jgi:hypothetical protein
MNPRVTAVLPVLADLLVPTVGYAALHAAKVPDVWALTVAGSAAGVLTLVNSIHKRKLDLLGALVLAELLVSIVLAVWTDDARLVLARSAVYVGVGGAALVLSAIAGRPMTYGAAAPMAHKGNPRRARAYALAWDNSAQLRRVHSQLTAFIGIAMLAFAVLRVVIIYTASSVSQAVWAQEVPGIVLLVFVVLMIRLRVPALRRIVDAEQARLPQDGLAVSQRTPPASGAEGPLLG